MFRKTLLCLAVTLLISPAFAQVYKWKDADGNTHYDDAPALTGVGQVKIDKQTDEQIANGKKNRAETEKSKRILEEMEKSNRQDAAAAPAPASPVSNDSSTGTTPATPMRRY